MKYKGELLLILSAFLFAITSILVKFVSKEFSGMFISLIRFIVGLILGYFILKFQKIPIRINDTKSWVLRGIFGALGMITMYVGISLTSSGRATMLSNTYPIFVAFFGWIFFKEKVSPISIVSLILCVTGAAFIFWDNSNYSKIGDLISLASGLFGGMAINYLRRGIRFDNPIIIYLSTCIFGLILIPFTFKEWKNINLINFSYLMLVAVVAFVAQIAMTAAYRYLSATKGSIISYTGIPLTLLLSNLFVNEIFKKKFFIGIILISIGLFFTIYIDSIKSRIKV
ncbi:MAG: EamA family transporter [Spirochaetales bacterium]|jgi:drug/metabolite transporter (DMT)-like permease|nr:EamA family transporter [Exilispira sp.]NMC67766.1 EamA family transporter [Spirochaetales bacterium]